MSPNTDLVTFASKCDASGTRVKNKQIQLRALIRIERLAIKQTPCISFRALSRATRAHVRTVKDTKAFIPLALWQQDTVTDRLL
jgi:hypothetical protein